VFIPKCRRKTLYGQFCKNTPDMEICMGITQITWYKIEFIGLYAGRERFVRGTNE
jgi:hypothetical protein